MPLPRLLRRRPVLRPRPRAALAHRAHHRDQPAHPLPTPPPHQATPRLATTPGTRRHRHLDRPHRSGPHHRAARRPAHLGPPGRLGRQRAGLRHSVAQHRPDPSGPKRRLRGRGTGRAPGDRCHVKHPGSPGAHPTWHGGAARLECARDHPPGPAEHAEAELSPEPGLTRHTAAAPRRPTCGPESPGDECTPPSPTNRRSDPSQARPPIPGPIRCRAEPSRADPARVHQHEPAPSSTPAPWHPRRAASQVPDLSARRSPA